MLELRLLRRAGHAGEDLEAAVDLQRVGGDRHRPPAARADPLGDGDRHVGLADAGRTEEREQTWRHAASMGNEPGRVSSEDDERAHRVWPVDRI